MEKHIENGIKYYKGNGRMIYNPTFHGSHNKGWTREQLAFLVQMRPSMSYRDISMAIGKTENTCCTVYCNLKKKGLLDKYKRF